jgi:hypothetical protein
MARPTPLLHQRTPPRWAHTPLVAAPAQLHLPRIDASGPRRPLGTLGAFDTPFPLSAPHSPARSSSLLPIQYP